MKKRCFLSFLLLFMLAFASAQSSQDVFLLAEKRNQEALAKITYQRPQTALKQGLISRYNPVTLTFKGMLFFYQEVVSMQLASNCPYHISCARFSLALIKEFGIMKGVFLTADRLTRCSSIALPDHPDWEHLHTVHDHTHKLGDHPIDYRFKEKKK